MVNSTSIYHLPIIFFEQLRSLGFNKEGSYGKHNVPGIDSAGVDAVTGLVILIAIKFNWNYLYYLLTFI